MAQRPPAVHPYAETLSAEHGKQPAFAHPYDGSVFKTQMVTPGRVASSHFFWSAGQPAVYGSVLTTSEHAAPGMAKTRSDSTTLTALRVKLDTIPPIQATSSPPTPPRIPRPASPAARQDSVGFSSRIAFPSWALPGLDRESYTNCASN